MIRRVSDCASTRTLFVTASDEEACIGWFLDCGIAFDLAARI